MPNLHNRYKSAERKISQKNPEYMLNYSFPCSCSKNLSLFWFIIKQQWTIEELSISSNSSHLEWRTGMSDTILKGTHPRTIPARFGLIWFRGFRGEDLNVKVYDVRRTDGRRTPSDGKSSPGQRPGELKINNSICIPIVAIWLWGLRNNNLFASVFDICSIFSFPVKGGSRRRVPVLSNARAKWSRLPEKYHKPRLLQTDWQITKHQDAWKLLRLFL
jgi:hypothetical protein